MSLLYLSYFDLLLKHIKLFTCNLHPSVAKPPSADSSNLDLAALKMLSWEILSAIYEGEMVLREVEGNTFPLSTRTVSSTCVLPRPQDSTNLHSLYKENKIPVRTHFSAVHFMLLSFGLPHNNILSNENEESNVRVAERVGELYMEGAQERTERKEKKMTNYSHQADSPFSFKFMVQLLDNTFHQ